MSKQISFENFQGSPKEILQHIFENDMYQNVAVINKNYREKMIHICSTKNYTLSVKLPINKQIHGDLYIYKGKVYIGYDEMYDSFEKLLFDFDLNLEKEIQNINDNFLMKIISQNPDIYFIENNQYLGYSENSENEIIAYEAIEHLIPKELNVIQKSILKNAIDNYYQNLVGDIIASDTSLGIMMKTNKSLHCQNIWVCYDGDGSEYNYNIDDFVEKSGIPKFAQNKLLNNIFDDYYR